MITITLNGESSQVPDGLSVGALLDHLGIEKDRVAVERNEAIVKKMNWEATPVESGDRMEVVTFVGGGVPTDVGTESAVAAGSKYRRRRTERLRHG